jgi:predicted PurR-regulated permease PerM
MKNTSNCNSVYDTSIRMLILFFIIGACLLIMFPFLNILLWTIILAMAMFPIHSRLSKKLRGKSKLASFIIIFTILVMVILPIWMLIDTLIEEVKSLDVLYDNGTLTIPKPDERVKELPIFGSKLYDVWHMASLHMDRLVLKYQEQLIAIGSTIGKEIFSAASSIIQIMISLFLAGIVLVLGKSGENIRKFFKKAGGKNGDNLADITLKTVGSVVKGVIGESFVMAFLNGIVFFLAGVPFAGILTLFAFIFAVLQIPILVVTIPIVIYFFIVKAFVPALIWTIVLLLVSLSDNVLTPLMLGKGAPVPMVVIFIGVIGGFVLSGFIGLFTGAIIMSIGYTLFMEWINSDDLEVNGE